MPRQSRCTYAQTHACPLLLITNGSSSFVGLDTCGGDQKHDLSVVVSREQGLTEECVDILAIEDKVKLINASGVFFHLEELHSVIKGIKKCLMEDGVFIVQFMYLGDMIRKLSFDGIYHEHLCYYSVQSLSNLLKPYGLEIFDGYHSEIHGGSIIAKVCHSESGREETERFKELKKEDRDLVSYESLKSFLFMHACST